MQISVREVARLLSVTEKTIYRWLKKGQIPAIRVGDLYRFNRLEILDWATARRIPIAQDILLSEEATGEMDALSLTFALKQGGINYRVGGSDRDSCLKAVVECLHLPSQADSESLYQVLLAREKLASTGIGDGIAIPHARSPIIYHMDSPQVSLCFLEKPVEFNSLDGKPVYALFTLICPTVKSHLHLLSRLSFVLHDSEFKKMIETQAPREEIIAHAVRVEAGLAQRDNS
jgi:nitrogen PTS system EIIA component